MQGYFLLTFDDPMAFESDGLMAFDDQKKN